MSNFVEKYGWKESAAPCSSSYINKAVVEKINQFEGVGKILDIGCGNGALCKELAEFNYNVTGIEPDADGAKIAQEMSQKIVVYNLGVEDDPDEVIKNGKFDVVVSTEVIEHLYSPHLLPKFSFDVLNDGGLLIITTPYHGYLKNLALSLLNKWDNHHTALWHGGHIKFWSFKTLTTLLEDNGFKVVSFKGLGRAAFLWKSMLVVAEKKGV